MHFLFVYRERERQNQREELWVHVESLAARSPGYEIIKSQQNSEIDSVTNSPDQDEDLNLDNFEMEAQEVWQ